MEVKKILQATPSKLRREMGMCATTIYVQQKQQYYAIRVLVVRTPVSSLSFQVQHTWYIRPGRHAHEPGTSSASCCCTGAWVESKHMYLIHTCKCGSLSFIFTHPPENEKRKKEKHTWYLVRYMQAPNRLYKSEVRASVLRVKAPCEQGLPHCSYVLQAEQRLPSATEEKAKRSFPMERGPTAKHHSLCVESAVHAVV